MANPTSCLTLGLASTPECSQVMALYCSTDDSGSGQTYTQKWQGDELTSPCRRFVALNLGNQRQYVPVVDAYVRRYLLTERRAISYPAQGSSLYDPAIADVVQVCQTYPGACDNVLQTVCSGFTAQELGGNPSQASLCGCFLSSAEYNKSGGVFGVGRECSPTCLLQSAVKPRDPSSQTDFLRCKQSICIIDDVTINILGKSTAGNISFNQACSSCGTGAANSSSSCICSISDVSITAVESTIKDTSFTQQCGGAQNVRCFKRDINGVPQSIPCNSLDPATANPATTTTSLTSSRLRTILIISIVVIVVIIIIVIVVLLLNHRTITLRQQQ
jgi:hypothetical protein